MAAAAAEPSAVIQARELLDTYFGDRTLLTRAAALLEQAHRDNPNNASIFVEAGRLTVKGGHTTFARFVPGTVERYEWLLDKAVALDPSNAKAYILKAEVFGLRGKPQERLAALKKAQALGTDDPWLMIGFGKYYMDARDGAKCLESFTAVERRGPGSTVSDRRAYIEALSALARFDLGDEPHRGKARRYAAQAMKARHPTDAWTPLGFAELFLDYEYFDEAILYSREALETMDFGAGRMVLAASLYAKAAQMIMANSPMKDARPFILEAEKLRFGKAEIIEYLTQRRGKPDNLKALEPTLNRIIQ